jgi:hypothetical protein
MTSADLAQPFRTEAEAREEGEALAVAVAWRKIIWRQAARDEDERIDRLTAVCIRLCDGDFAAGRQLATRAIWTVR